MVGRMTGSIVGGMSGPLTLRKGGFDWYPGVLYQPGDILLWYDPSDLTTMYQDVAGTSPVTADGQSVLLMLDKGQWGGKTLTQVLAAQAPVFDEDYSSYADDAALQAAYTLSANAGLTLSNGAARLENLTASTNWAYRLFTTVVGRMYRVTATKKTASPTLAARVGIATAANATNLGVMQFSAGSAEQTLTIVFTATGTTTYMNLLTNNGTINLFVEFDDIVIKEIPGYHRVQATPSQAPKYKTDGTLHWLLYDGTDDGAVTPTINWGTDEVAICAGITKSSDAAAGAFAELSATSASNNGTFAMLAPASAAANYYWRSKGTGDANMTVTTYTAPTTNVLTGQGKIATDLATLRADGSEVGTSATDQGTGNFGNHILYFGRRGGSSLPFNGKEHQTVIRSRLLSASELAKLETFVAAKTGVIL
jgi:hypothetical protein